MHLLVAASGSYQILHPDSVLFPSTQDLRQLGEVEGRLVPRNAIFRAVRDRRSLNGKSISARKTLSNVMIL